MAIRSTTIDGKIFKFLVYEDILFTVSAGTPLSNISKTNTRHIYEKSLLHSENGTSKIPVCIVVSSSYSHQGMRKLVQVRDC